LALEHWLLHVKGQTLEDLRSLVALPNKDDQDLEALHKHVIHYLTVVQSLITNHLLYSILHKIAQTGK
jgi:hypothetical protein